MDYRSMVNPTYLTAKATLFMLASAGNEDAGKVIETLKLRNDMMEDTGSGEQQSPMSEADTNALKLGAALAVEARYEALTRYISKNGVKNLLDVACGYSPRALLCFREGVDYVGFDVPLVAEELQRLAFRTGITKDHPVYVSGDATNAASLKTASDLLTGELLISSEGLLSYLTADEAEQFVDGIRDILANHGGAWITSDPGVDYEKFAVANMADPDAVRLYQEARIRKMKESDIYNEGVTGWSSEKLQQFLESRGFTVEKLPFYYEDEDLTLLNGIPEQWAKVFKDLLKEASVWKMTADSNARVEKAIQGAKTVENLKIDFVKSNGVLNCGVTGRIDTLSAPALLEVFEKNYDGTREIRIDAKALEYISSAGLRVLVLAVKKLGKDSVKLDNVSDEIRGILETAGFTSLL